MGNVENTSGSVGPASAGSVHSSTGDGVGGGGVMP